MISLIKAVRSDWKSASVPESFLPGIIRELSIVTMASSFIISKGDWRLPLGMLIVFHFISILAEDSGADKGGQSHFARADAYVYVALLGTIGTYLSIYFAPLYGLVGGILIGISLSIGFLVITAGVYEKIVRSRYFYKEIWRMNQEAKQEVIFGNDTSEDRGTLVITPDTFHDKKDYMGEYERIRFKDGVYSSVDLSIAGSFIYTPTGKVIFHGHIDPKGKKPIPYLPYLIPTTVFINILASLILG